jgi:hypothetical protein
VLAIMLPAGERDAFVRGRQGRPPVPCISDAALIAAIGPAAAIRS